MTTLAKSLRRFKKVSGHISCANDIPEAFTKYEYIHLSIDTPHGIVEGIFDPTWPMNAALNMIIFKGFHLKK